MDCKSNVIMSVVILGDPFTKSVRIDLERCRTNICVKNDFKYYVMVIVYVIISKKVDP